MNTNDVIAIVDVISSKLGLAVSEAKPLVDDVVRQVQIRALGLAIFSAAAFVFFFVIVVLMLFSVKKNDERADLALVVLTIASSAMVVSYFACVINFADFLAPLCYLIGK
jgi:asparagine N-glycosylation enzyme membrane subunit Stt3